MVRYNGSFPRISSRYGKNEISKQVMNHGGKRREGKSKERMNDKDMNKERVNGRMNYYYLAVMVKM